MYGLDDAADLDIHVAILREFTNVDSVLPEADDGEAAGIVGSLRRADVEEACAVWKFDDIIDVRGDAHILVEVFRGVFHGDARAGFGCLDGEVREDKYEDETEDGALRH